MSQLSLLRPPALELTERGRKIPAHVRGLYGTLISHVRELRCRGRVAGVHRRRRWTKSPGWPNAACLRQLGIDRRQFGALERHGLIAWDGADLVLPRYHRSAEWREEEDEDRRRRHLRSAGIASGKARRLKKAHPERGVDPYPEHRSIRESISNEIEHLHATVVRTLLTALEQGGLIDLPSKGDPGVPTDGSGSPEPFEERPVWAPSDLKRMAAASRPTVANRVLRRRKVGPAPAAPPARLAARTPPIPRNVRRGPRTGPETSKPGGFKPWFDRFHRITGKPYARQEALEYWPQLEMTPAEEGACRAFSEVELRKYSARRPPPDAFQFLRWVWAPEMQRRRRARRADDGLVGDDVVGAVLKNLKRRNS